MNYNETSQWAADLGSGYSSIRPLGEGGMGTLYRAHKDSLDVDVVIKRVKQKFKGRMDERAEANILKTLKHKYLPRIYDVIESPSGYVYTIMDMIPGENMQNYVKTHGPVSQKLAYRWACQLCEVIAYLHSQVPPILHCDIKPSNIMITPNEDICVIDFNTSLVFSKGVLAIGATPGYAAPEQYTRPGASPDTIETVPLEETMPLRGYKDAFAYQNVRSNKGPSGRGVSNSVTAAQATNAGGYGTISKRTDVYGIGATLYYAITGQQPGHSLKDVRPITSYKLKFSRSFLLIIARAMKKRQEERFCDAQEMLRPEYEEGKQQFIEEACALQELRENISVVDILDFFEENGTAYFAMELIEGCNLRVFRKNHNPKQTLKMALQMLFLLGSSLAEVHRFGMIHGDISPENILITQDGEIKLIDFGAARSFRQGSDNKERKIYLKPNYAPYEQYTQKPCQGPWTDIYALAATFYFIVSGRKMLDALSRAKGASYPPLHELCPAVSRQLSDVIDKALAFDYHDRYRRMLDFLDALEQVVRPEDYDIDLGALMPKSKASKQAEIHVETSDDSEKMCQVEEQNMPEPKRLAAFFHPKKRRLAYLELTMRKSGGHISRRRWIIEPNRTVKVGRLATSDVMMPADNQISRNHCEVFYNEPKREFIVRDLSKYGTYLADGKPMEKEKSYTLKDGDIFCVVSPEYTFKVVIET